MIISEVYVDNFRNLIDFKIQISEFGVIVGENNIGKTNLLIAINKVLSGKRIYFDSNDFNNPEKPIIIDLTFSHLSQEDEALFYDPNGLINPKTGEGKIRTKAKWNEDTGSVDVSIVFIREDLTEEKEKNNVTWSFRQNLSCSYISASRDLNRELNNKSGGMFKLFKSFSPYSTLPFSSLKAVILEKIDNITTLTPETSLFLPIKEMIRKSSFNDINIELDKLNKYIETDIDNVLLKRKMEHLNGLINVFQKRAIIINELDSLNKEFKESYGLKSLEEDMNELSNEILVNKKLNLNFLTVNDEDFLKQLQLDIEDYSILRNGDGYQNIINLIIKLLDVSYSVKIGEMGFKFFIIIIEEPESHLHPHLQRNLVTSLIEIQKKFKEKGINFQLIISTHSPFIISRLSLDNLIFLRKTGKDRIISKKIDKNEFIEEIRRLGKSGLTKSSTIKRSLEILFYNYSEIFFSKCVIIGEGETEQGAIPLIGEKIGFSLDKYGISFLRGEGNNIFTYMKLLTYLDIPWVLITDRDNKDNFNEYDQIIDEETIEHHELEFEDSESTFKKYWIVLTKEKAFEKEIISKVPWKKILNAVEMKSPETEKVQYRIQEIKREFPSLNGKDIKSLGDSLDYLEDKYYNKFRKKTVLHYMKQEKGLLFGRILVEMLDEEEIPKSFVIAIKKAKELSESFNGD